MECCTSLSDSDGRLAEAVNTAERQSPGDAGWTLRNAMDAVLADCRAGKPLLPAAAPAPTPEPAAAAAGAAPTPPARRSDFSSLSLEQLVIELKKANASKRWDVEEPQVAALCSAFCEALPGGSRAWLTKISAVISLGVPLWNSGDYAGTADGLIISSIYFYCIHIYMHIYHVYVCACVCACACVEGGAARSETFLFYTPNASDTYMMHGHLL